MKEKPRTQRSLSPPAEKAKNKRQLAPAEPSPPRHRAESATRVKKVKRSQTPVEEPRHKKVGIYSAATVYEVCVFSTTYTMMIGFVSQYKGMLTA